MGERNPGITGFALKPEIHTCNRWMHPPGAGSR